MKVRDMRCANLRSRRKRGRVPGMMQTLCERRSICCAPKHPGRGAGAIRGSTRERV